MSSVYKSRFFVTDNEKVPIPDADFSEAEKLPKPPDGGLSDEENAPTSGESESAEDLSETAEDETFSEQAKPLPEDTELDEPVSVPSPDEPPRTEQPVTKELIGEYYSEELRQLAAEVAQQAYFDALNKKKAELRDCVSNVQQAMDELVRAQQQFMSSYTDELKYMAVDIAEKMIYEKISEDDLILKRLVMQSVAVVKNADWLNVEVSERLVGLIDQINSELDKPEYDGKAHVFPVAGTDGVCRVVTNEGALVSTIEVQADNLRRAFRELDQQEGNAPNEMDQSMDRQNGRL